MRSSVRRRPIASGLGRSALRLVGAALTATSGPQTTEEVCRWDRLLTRLALRDWPVRRAQRRDRDAVSAGYASD